ncbi:MAG: YwmB family TATA-box binding protein [Desulfotomaculaceae bacterium]|nr:YwmB family TATA-box binding protein [Desulfotomaculaceae bacterium]
MRRTLLRDCSTKKKYILTILMVLIVILMVLALRPLGLKMVASYREEQALMDLMSLCGAELESINVTGWARVTGPKEIAPETLVNHTAGLLKLAEGGRTMEKWENPYARGVKLQGIMPGGNAVAVLSQTMELLQGQRVTHLMISLGTDAGKAGFYKERIRQTLTTQSTDEHVALTYTGKINYALNQEELSARAEEVMAGAGATIQEKTVKDNLVSLTGHSPSLPVGLNYDGRDVNLNVALRSNSQEQATYVYVASPVIYTEY